MIIRLAKDNLTVTPYWFGVGVRGQYRGTQPGPRPRPPGSLGPSRRYTGDPLTGSLRRSWRLIRV
eukprot:696484-Hanusia_phi.AAC.1